MYNIGIYMEMLSHFRKLFQKHMEISTQKKNSPGKLLGRVLRIFIQIYAFLCFPNLSFSARYDHFQIIMGSVEHFIFGKTYDFFS